PAFAGSSVRATSSRTSAGGSRLRRRAGPPARPGGITRLRESQRAAWGLPWLDGFALDAKLGLRMLRRSWGLTLAAGLAMTIVITMAAVAFVFLDQFMGRVAPPLDQRERV